MAAQAANQQPSLPQTGQVYAVNEHIIAITGVRYFLGNIKTDARPTDIVTFEADDHRNILSIKVIERGDSKPPAPETQPAGPEAEEKKPPAATTPKGSAKKRTTTGPGTPSTQTKKDPAPAPSGKFTLPAWIPNYCHNGKDGCNFYATGGFCGKAGSPISEMKACPAPREGSGTPPAAVTRQAEADRTSEMLGQAVQEVKDRAAQGVPAGQQAPKQDPPAAGTGQSAPVQQPVVQRPAEHQGSCQGCNQNDNEVSETAYPVPVQQSHAVAPAMSWTKEEYTLIKNTVANGCTDTEFQFLMYQAKTYGLDPLRKQIWAVKYGAAPAAIFCGRDGYLEIAHRSGKFDGMESGTKTDGDELVGWCKVYRTDMTHPFYVEVYLTEYKQVAKYSGKLTLWDTKPRVMIQKVAESQCLRRAFSISGIYSPEEFDTERGA